MVANSYATNHQLKQSEIVSLLQTGFTGTLRFWWDKHLTEDAKLRIIHAYKTNDEGYPIFDECIGRSIEDGVNVLLYTIIEHFIGICASLLSATLKKRLICIQIKGILTVGHRILTVRGIVGPSLLGLLTKWKLTGLLTG
ncbi:hypothetical protein L3X38_018060 [Prunus dulcis]|uniref:DUF7746 domain-containing protein n=1 Tax=Prunus dulcis TaxID=3755 RepID=A0AAD4W9B8_PRUDU|nr:hypothetical protein L3X38_018060 [Prunus dulcis]